MVDGLVKSNVFHQTPQNLSDQIPYEFIHFVFSLVNFLARLWSPRSKWNIFGINRIVDHIPVVDKNFQNQLSICLLNVESWCQV